jgi:hypothetical protein
MSTAPGSGLVLASTGPKDLELVDPAGQTIVAKYTADSLTSTPAVNFNLFALSPDGKNAFCTGSESICEFSVSDSGLTFVSAGPKLGSDAQKIVVSADSRYVAMPCRNGNTILPGEPKKTVVTYVFKIGDLEKPVMTIESGLSPKELAFDAPARQIYAQNTTRQLMVFSPTGDKIKEYVLSKDKNTDIIKFVVHPSGRSLLVLTGTTLQLVTLP